MLALSQESPGFSRGEDFNVLKLPHNVLGLPCRGGMPAMLGIPR